MKISHNAEKCVGNEALPTNQDIASPHSSADDAETDYFLMEMSPQLLLTIFRIVSDK